MLILQNTCWVTSSQMGELELLLIALVVGRNGCSVGCLSWPTGSETPEVFEGSDKSKHRPSIPAASIPGMGPPRAEGAQKSSEHVDGLYLRLESVQAPALAGGAEHPHLHPRRSQQENWPRRLMRRERCLLPQPCLTGGFFCFVLFFMGTNQHFFSLRFREMSHSCCRHLGKPPRQTPALGNCPTAAELGLPRISRGVLVALILCRNQGYEAWGFAEQPWRNINAGAS